MCNCVRDIISFQKNQMAVWNIVKYKMAAIFQNDPKPSHITLYMKNTLNKSSIHVIFLSKFKFLLK